MNGQTVSSVHSVRDMLAQRQRALARAQCALSGTQLYAQISVGLSLYVYDHVSTPGYLSLLLMLPYLLLICLISKRLARRAGEAGVLTLAGRPGARVLALCLFFIHLTDGLMLFLALCAMAEDVMPDLAAGWTAAFIALTLGLALGKRSSGAALPRLARLVRWAAGLMLGFCLLSALPHGSAAHFFPLLGYGPASILRGGLWMCGCAAGSLHPLLSPEGDPAAQRIMGERQMLLPPLLAALAAGIVTMLGSVWLMPVYFMARPETLGWRLLVLTNMTPSVPAWSLNVMGLLLLLLTALCASVRQAAAFLSYPGKGSSARVSPVLMDGLLLVLAAVCAAVPRGLQQALLWIAPLRAAAALFVLLALWLLSCFRSPKSPEKEAVP